MMNISPDTVNTYLVTLAREYRHATNLEAAEAIERVLDHFFSEAAPHGRWIYDNSTRLATISQYENLPYVEFVRDCYPTDKSITLILKDSTSDSEINRLSSMISKRRSITLKIYLERMSGPKNVMPYLVP